MDDHEHFFKEAAKEAKMSLCLRSRCGAVLVKGGKIIGRGYNAPPNDDAGSRKCGIELSLAVKPKADKSCCVHAEWRAITDALRTEGDLHGSVMYFTRDDGNGERHYSGDPYCTICSRLALDSGVSKWALWHESGIRTYDAKEYDELSFKFHMPRQ